MSSVIRVELGERSYAIVVAEDDVASWGRPLAEWAKERRVAVITDETVEGLYRDDFGRALADASAGRVSWYRVPPGEASKSRERLWQLYDALLGDGFGRDGLICALGGGVIGDLAGFVAATVHRGVDWIQVPTTLLAMVDSGIGGKTGVNHAAGKNLIGAFHQPKAVLANLRVLETLARRELAAGFAEVIKYGVIWDADLFATLETEAPTLLALASEHLLEIVLTSARIKAEVVRRDERETDLRAVLNFGHTLGHAIERTAGYGHWLHGEAVAVGMVLAARFGERLAITPTEAVARIETLIRAFELPAAVEPKQVGPLAEAVPFDKKVRGEQIRFVFATDVGCAEIRAIPLARLTEWLRRIEREADSSPPGSAV